MSPRHFFRTTASLCRRTALAAVVLAALGAGAVGADTASARVRVAAVVSVNTPASVVQAGLPVTFTGAVSPAYVGERVVLQRLRRNGRWLSIAVGYVVGPGGDFSVTHVFVRASGGAPATLRVKVPRNALSARAFSSLFPVTILPRPHRHPGLRAQERRRRREERRHHHQQVVEERRRHHQQVLEERRRHHQQKLEEKRRRREERRARREAKHKLRSADGGRHHG